MTYNHSRKAGNQGDVWKHFVLVELANAIAKESDEFRYVESHSGVPVHELADRGEWRRGIGKIDEDTSCNFKYLSFARKWLKVKQYPSGWIFMASQLAERFARVEVKLFDTSDGVASKYPPATDVRIPNNIITEFSQKDGYMAVEKLVEPNFVFLDPPYRPNAKADWRSLARVCSVLGARHIDFAAWYPFYWPTKPRELSNRTNNFAWEVHWASCGPKPSQNLKGCGMLVSNNLVSIMDNLQVKLNRMASCMQSKLIIRQPVEQSH